MAALTVLVVFANKYGNVWHVVGLPFTVQPGPSLPVSTFVSYPEKGEEGISDLDHSSIFLLIAGTYTPITLISYGYRVKSSV